MGEKSNKSEKSGLGEASHLILVFCVCLCVYHVAGIPGRWEQLILHQGAVVNLADVGFSPIHIHSLVFGVQACEELIITFSEVLDQSKGYVMVYLGYQQNNYTLLIPSTHCDENGTCTPTDYIAGNFLDCSTPKYFWMKWDNHGILELGKGWVIGQDLILHTNYSGEFELHSCTFRVNYAKGGIAVVNIDSRPKFVSPPPDGTYSIVVDETDQTGLELFTLEAEDPEGDNVTFNVVGDYADMFNVSGNSFYNLQPLDYEKICSLDVTLSASDQAGEVNTTLTIRVGDVIDEAPQLIISAVAIPEELAVGTAIDGGFAVIDNDKNDTESFVITGPHSDYFSVLEDWKFEIMKRIDFENGSAFLDLLVLTVLDSGGLNSSALLNITILDMNDNPPIFSSPLYYTSVRENSTKETKELITLNCTDADSGANGLLNMSLIDGFKDADEAMFVLDPDTFGLHAKSDIIDYETLADRNYTFIITVMAFDQPTSDIPNTAYATVVVRVQPENDNMPEWSSTVEDLEIPESLLPGSYLTSFKATDADHGADGDIIYTVTNVTSDGKAFAGLFAIDSSGNLTVSGDLDIDTATGGVPYYTVTVEASDEGIPPQFIIKTTTFQLLDVNDNIPVFAINGTSVTIPENSSIGDIAYTFNVVDKDNTANLSVTLGGDGSDDFEVTDNATLIKGDLDYERKSSYNLFLTASDGKHTVSQAITIYVSDVIDEAPVITVFPFLTLPEELPINTVIGKLFDVSDRDENDTLTYQLRGTDRRYFTINPVTGMMNIAQGVDRENGTYSLDDLRLVVTDTSGNQTEAQLAINITNINDNAPTCVVDVDVINVTENTPEDSVLALITCTDDDEGDSVVVSLVGDNDKTRRFKVNDSQLMTSSIPLDYESVGGCGSYRLVLEAVDTGGSVKQNSATLMISVQVRGENEYTPEWTGQNISTQIQVDETGETGLVILQVRATDQDAGPDGVIKYRVMDVVDDSGNSSSDIFIIDELSGTIKTTKPLDSDLKTGGVAAYNISVLAYDQGAVSRETSLNITVTVNNINDNMPYFKNFQNKITVPEDCEGGGVVYNVTGFDADGDTLAFHLVDGDVNYFSVNGSSIYLLQALDFENQSLHTMSLSLSDGKFDVNETLFIFVTDVIDEPPQLLPVPGVMVAEELPVGTVIGGVFRVLDADRDDQLTYSLSGTDSEYFSLDNSTGELRVRSRLDADSLSSLYLGQLSVYVEDRAGLNSSTSLNISLVDVDDNSPTFSQSLYRVDIRENTSNGTILTLNVTDLDVGVYGTFNISILNDGDVKSNMSSTSNVTLPDVGNSVFSVAGLELQVSSLIDYEELEAQNYMYILTLRATAAVATEGRSNTADAVVIVQVLPENEFSPQWNQSVDVNGSLPELHVYENVSCGAVVGQYVATDDDAGDDGELMYTVVYVVSNRGDNETSLFNVDASTGELRVNGDLDIDETTGGVEYYNITLVVKDGGNPPQSIQGMFTIFLLNSNDNPPSVNIPKSISVSEDVEIGSELYNFSTVIDPDGDDVEVFIPGNSSFFHIVNGSLILLQTLDYETEPSFTIPMVATDGKYTTAFSLSLRVQDVVDEAPVVTVLETLHLLEELPVGFTLGPMVDVRDPDRNDTITYSLQPFNANETEYLKIDPDSGELSVARRVDRDGDKGVTNLLLNLTVTDSVNISVSRTLNITVLDVNDNPPVCTTGQTLLLTENTPANISLAVINCTDDDMISNMTMELLKDNSSSPFLLINSELLTSYSVDLETCASSTFALKIQVTDRDVTGSVNTAIITFDIQVVGENEFTPEWSTNTPFTENNFTDSVPELNSTASINESSSNATGTEDSWSVTLREDSPIGDIVVQLNATDGDVGPDGTVTYTILDIYDDTGTRAPGIFSIDGHTGVLAVRKFLDYDKPTGGSQVYNITISAADQGTPSLNSSTSITVNIINVNDNPPSFLDFTRLILVPENKSMNDSITNIASYDADGDVLDLRLLDGDLGNFYLNESNLMLQRELDFESQSFYRLVISLSDGLNNITDTVVIKVTDIIDESPKLVIPCQVQVQADLPVGTVIGGLFSVNDLDKGDNFTFTLTGNQSSYLDIDNTTGEVRVGSSLQSLGSTYLDQVSLRVVDLAGLSDTLDLNITVLPAVPVSDLSFSSSVYTVNVTENTYNATVLVLNVTDNKAADTGDVSIIIESGDEGGAFSMEGVELRVEGAVDYELLEGQDFTFILTLRAAASTTGTNSNTAIAVVIVKVLPINEYQPQWFEPTHSSDANTSTVDSYNATISYNSTNVTYISNSTDVYSLNVTNDTTHAPETVTYNTSLIEAANESSSTVREEGSVPEDTPVGTVIMRLTATDQDKGVDGSLTYIITSVTSGNGEVTIYPFAIDITSGELRVSNDLDSDEPIGSWFVLTVQAQDGGLPRRSVDKNITINVLNVNDNPPSLPNRVIRVQENSTVGTGVMSYVSVRDVDGDNLTFALPEASEWFQLINDTVYIAKRLDFESVTMHSLIVSSTDGVYSINASLTIFVDDVIDEIPDLRIFEPVQIQEELAVNTTLGRIFCVTDRDQSDNHIFTLKGNASSYLGFDPQTNQLQVISRINRDGPEGVVKLTNITLTVTDSAGLVSSATFDVTILDVDDHPPEFSQIYYYATVAENSTYANLVNLSLTDMDGGSVDDVTLKIVDGDPDSLFSLNNSALYVDGSRLDMDPGNHSDNAYTLTVVTEGGAMTGTTVVVVVVQPENEFSPLWISGVDGQGYLPNITVNENVSVGSEITLLTATDADIGDDGVLVYQLRNTDTSTQRMFNLNERTGSLRLAAVLDADVGTGGSDVYELSFKVSDRGRTSFSSDAKLRIFVRGTNDNAPTITSSVRSIRVLENASIDDVLLKIPTSDFDGDDVMLSIVGGSDVIGVNGSSVLLKKVPRNISVSCPTVILRVGDGEMYSDYTYLIQVTSSNVTDVNIRFVDSYSIPEEMPVGTVLGGLFTVISDGGSSLQYSMKESGTNYFDMDYQTGEIKVKQRIDRDGEEGVTSIRNVTISVTDNLSRETSKTYDVIVLDVNDNPPVFTQSTYSITAKENTLDGPDLRVGCDDMDSGPSGQVVMTLVGDLMSGTIALVGRLVSVNATSLDYDTDPDLWSPLILTLQAVDQSNNYDRFTSQALLVITIEPVNEYAPYLAETDIYTTIKEDSGMGSLVVRLTATDQDRGPDGQLSYNLLAVQDESSNEDFGTFELHPTTGELRTLVNLDTDAATGGVKSYVIKYNVKDGGNPSRESQGQVTLTLLPVNEHAPELSKVSNKIDIKEDAPMSAVVGTVAATDRDGDNITYSVSGNVFRFVGADLTLVKKLDFKADNCQMFTVSATDGSRSSSRSFLLNVIQVNVTRPAPKIRALTSPTVLEEQPIGTLVSLFQSVEGGSPPLTYSITGAHSGYFTMDSSTGETRLAQLIDYDGLNGTKLLDQATLTVNDSAGQTDWLTFKITVTDINDNSPVCPQSEYVVMVTENTPPGKLLTTLDCYDLDGGVFGVFNITIDGEGPLASFFSIRDRSIYTSNTPVDYELLGAPPSPQRVRVVLRDNPLGNVRLSSTVFVSVQISPVNEFEPVWANTNMTDNTTFSSVTLNEDVAVGSVVTTVTATDTDAGPDGQVSYRLLSVTSEDGENATSLFVVEENTGSLRTTVTLDADTSSNGSVLYNVTVNAMDNATNPKSVQGLMQLIVQNVNDNPPTFDATEKEISVYENTSIGDVIYTLRASDVDGDPVVFNVKDTLLEVKGSQLLLNTTLDYETERCVTVEITSFDGVFTVESTIVMKILDTNDESPVIQTYGTLSILEEQPIGTLVGGAYTVTDGDGGDVLTFAVVGNNSLFSINSTTGQLSIKRSVDSESINLSEDLQLTIKVTDAVGHSDTATLTFNVTDINDNAPECARQFYELNITENIDNNSSIFEAKCSDADKGRNGEITLSIIEGDDAGVFNTSGTMLFVGDIDYENMKNEIFSYRLTLALSDNAQTEAKRSTYIVVIVNILPDNEFAPVWSSPEVDNTSQFPAVAVGEDITPGSLILSFTASDRDLGLDGLLTYSVVTVWDDKGRDSKGLFSIDPRTGDFVTATPLDFDKQTGGNTNYNITIRAADSGTSPKFISGSLTLNITNYNDIEPKFSKTFYSIGVACNSYHGDILSNLDATDFDSESLYFTINGTSQFVSVNITTGSVVLHFTPEELALKEVTSDIFVVMVTDRGQPELKDFATVYITFDDCDRSTVSTTTVVTTTTLPVTTANTTSNETGCAVPRGQVLELMATRTLCGMLGVGMGAVLIIHLRRRKLPSTLGNTRDVTGNNRVGPTSFLERTGRNEAIKVGSNTGHVTSAAPIGHSRVQHDP